MTSNFLTKALYSTALSMTFASFASATFAQEVDAEPAADEEVIFDTITVKGTKREQSLYEVPISISVIDSEQIERTGVTELEDYARVVPNLSFSSRGGRRQQDISIRGISPQAGTANSYGIYLDEFNVAPIDSERFNNPSLQDIEQIEVLRGPQGTLFGRSITAGAISITTKKPSDEFQADLTGEIASNDYRLVRGGIGGPIIDGVLAARFNAYYEESDGFLENQGPLDITNDFEESGARLALRLTPNNALTIDASISYWEGDEGIGNAIPSGFTIPQVQAFFPIPIPGFPGSAADFLAANGATAFPENVDNIFVDEPQSIASESLVWTGRAEYDFGGFSLIAVGGYLSSEVSIDNQEADKGINTYPFTAVGLGPEPIPGTFFLDADSTTLDEIESISGEVRLQSNGDQKLDWVVGVFVADDEEKQNQSIQLGSFVDLSPVPGFDPLVLLPEGTPFSEFFDVDKAESFAVFADFSYDLTDQLTASFGGRFSSDDVSTTGTNFGAPLPEQNATFEQFTPRFALNYQFSDRINSYVSASKGYRPGGFNGNPNFPPVFDEETLWNYEAGVKGVFLDGALDLRFAAFHMDWQDIQVSVFDVDLGQSFNENAGAATSQGFELEAFANPTENLSLGLGVGYADSEYDDYTDASVIGTSGSFDASGTKVRRAPEWNINASAEYVYPINEKLDLSVRGEYQFVDEQFQFTGEDLFGEYNRLPSYDVVNLRASLDGDNYSLIGFVENLNDERYIVGVDGGIYVTGYQYIIDQGRRIGARLKVRF